jgi:16S rRNA (adenine1518-N6/adenine1519-N6)-dimethyltransferase
VVAIEKDRKVFAVLKKLTAGKFPNLELRCDDILKFKPETLTPQARFKVVGNLPYYITTPIIEYLLRQRHLFDLTVIMVQREVASRMMAKPASGDYGSFSCFVQYYAEVSYVHTVKRNSFYPMPEVDSSILRMDFARKSAATIRDEELLFRIIRGAFNQRRKSISNSLSREKVLDIPKDALTAALERIGINPQTRPQDLSLSDFARICASLADFAGMK